MEKRPKRFGCPRIVRKMLVGGDLPQEMADGIMGSALCFSLERTFTRQALLQDTNLQGIIGKLAERLLEAMLLSTLMAIPATPVLMNKDLANPTEVSTGQPVWASFHQTAPHLRLDTHIYIYEPHYYEIIFQRNGQHSAGNVDSLPALPDRRSTISPRKLVGHFRDYHSVTTTAYPSIAIQVARRSLLLKYGLDMQRRRRWKIFRALVVFTITC
ncbi:hypothetical protein F4809DRAFT_181971 [Biscogniauxia mediterranea]|nr:hypothetical protein F4809DRAFT_181971 [Biscogniauxia mediterranea]